MFERCLYFNVSAGARVTTHLWSKAFEPFDLTPAQAYLVRTVLARPGLSQRELALELKLEKSTIVRSLDALEAKGLVRRKSEPSDAREKRIIPTEEAQKLRDPLEKTGNRLFARMVSTIGEDRLRETVANLRAINDILANEAMS